MKNLLMCLTLIFIYSIQSCVYVTPKEVTLRVHELGDNSGDITIMDKPGKYGIAGWGATDYSFPITEQNYRWTSDEQEEYGSAHDESVKLQIEGNDCNVDVGIRFFIQSKNEEQIKHLVTKYPTDLEGVVDGLLYEIVRGAIKKQFEGMTLDNAMDNLPSLMRGPVLEIVQSEAKAYAIEVVEVYDISGLKVPENIKKAKQATQESSQNIRRAEEDALAQAIKDKMLINSAKATAEATKIKNQNPPSNAVLDQLRIEKWNGVEAPGSDVIVMSRQQ